MKKPHEQEWRQYRSGNNNHGVTNEGHGVIATRIKEYDTAMLVSAAPDMARELLHLLRLMEPLEKDGGLDIPGLATLNGARAALKKAGVLT